ncbi:alcohol dehydrogenase superfamily protein [Pholiota molesta]|nr:alcohol dehydrogenase superfamily protein [Pholiota molesta]
MMTSYPTTCPQHCHDIMSNLPTTTKQYEITEIGSCNNLAIKEKPISKTKSNEVLVKVHAVSLQYRDLGAIIGFYPVAKPGTVPCSDMAGEVIAVGDEVKGWKAGDRVSSNFWTYLGDHSDEIYATSLGGQSPGVLTQYRNFPAQSLVRIPEHFTYEQASTLPCAALTAYNSLYGPHPLKAGDSVLVQGTGGVSMFALQFAVAAGATVIATSSSNEKLKIAQKHGAKHLINYKETPDWHKEVLKITNGRGVDHTVEVGGQGTLEKSINSTKLGGSIGVIGFVSGDAPPSNLIIPLISRLPIVRGIYVGSVFLFQDMIRLIEANPAETVPIVDTVFDFQDAAKAYSYLKSQKHVGKVVIRVN